MSVCGSSRFHSSPPRRPSCGVLGRSCDVERLAAERHAAACDGAQAGGGHSMRPVAKMKVIVGFHEAALKATAEFTGDQEVGWNTIGNHMKEWVKMVAGEIMQAKLDYDSGTLGFAASGWDSMKLKSCQSNEEQVAAPAILDMRLSLHDNVGDVEDHRLQG